MLDCMLPLLSVLKIDQPWSRSFCFYFVTRVPLELWQIWTVINYVNSVLSVYLILSSCSLPLSSSPFSCPGHEKDAISTCQPKSNQMSHFLMWWLYHKHIFISYFIHRLDQLFEHTNQYQIIQKQTINALFHHSDYRLALCILIYDIIPFGR